jgi:hypothetical protein
MLCEAENLYLPILNAGFLPRPMAALDYAEQPKHQNQDQNSA